MMARTISAPRGMPVLLLAVGAVTLLGFGLRLYRLGEASLWIDEAYSVWFSARDWAYLWGEVPKFETHPSFYYSVLKIWRGVVGDDEFSLRLLSALVNAATIPMIALTARTCGGPRMGSLAALLAALLFACSATQLNASQDARPYAFMTLAMTLGLFGSARVMMDPARAGRPMMQILRHDRGMAAAFGCIGTGLALLGWSHNLGTVFGLLLGLALLVWWFACDRSRGVFVNLLLAAGLAAVLYGPNLPIVAMQLQTMGEQGFWLARPGLVNLFRTMIQMPLGHAPFSGWQVVLGGIAILAGGAGFVALSRQARTIALLLLFMAIMPAALFFVLSRIGQPIFMFRTLQISQVPVIVLISFAPFALPRLKRGIAAGAVIGLILPLAGTHLQTAGQGSEDWRGIVTEIRHQSAGETPKVVILPAAAELPILYYAEQLDTPLEILSVPGSYPVRGEGHTYPTGGGGSPAITAGMIPVLEASLGTSERLWFITRRPDLYDKDALVREMVLRRAPCTVSGHAFATQHAAALPDGTCPLR